MPIRFSETHADNGPRAPSQRGRTDVHKWSLAKKIKRDWNAA